MQVTYYREDGSEALTKNIQGHISREKILAEAKEIYTWHYCKIGHRGIGMMHNETGWFDIKTLTRIKEIL